MCHQTFQVPNMEEPPPLLQAVLDTASGKTYTPKIAKHKFQEILRFRYLKFLVNVLPHAAAFGGWASVQVTSLHVPFEFIRCYCLGSHVIWRGKWKLDFISDVPSKLFFSPS